MSDKTCGDCRYFEPDDISACCEAVKIICNDKAPACKDFEPKPKPTNGDRIIAGGMSALVEYRQKFICHVCAYRFDKKCNGAKCKDGLIAWLNAPADCVKQNGNHDTQTDLCKADNTESEGKE